MDCKNCGKVINEKMKFCTSCGTPIKLGVVRSEEDKSISPVSEPSYVRKDADPQSPRRTSHKRRVVMQTKNINSVALGYYLVFFGLSTFASGVFEFIFIGVIISGIGFLFLNTDTTKVGYTENDKPKTIWTMLSFLIFIFIFQTMSFGKLILLLIIMTFAYGLSPPTHLIDLSTKDPDPDKLELKQFREVNGKPKASPIFLVMMSVIGSLITLISPTLGIIIFGLGLSEHVYALNESAMKLLRPNDPYAAKKTSQKYVTTPTAMRERRETSMVVDISSFGLYLYNIPITNISKVKVGLDNLFDELKVEQERIQRSVTALVEFQEKNSEALKSVESFIAETNDNNIENRIRPLRDLKKSLTQLKNLALDAGEKTSYITEIYIPFIRDELLVNLNQELEIVNSFNSLLDTARENLSSVVIQPFFTRSDAILSNIQSFETIYSQKIDALRAEQERREEEKYEIQSLKLKSVVSERRLSNLFAYFGVLFIVFGIFALLNFIYDNYILKIFPAQASASTAIQGVILIYLSGILLGFVLPRILNIFVKLPQWGFNLFYCIGFITIQGGLFVQKSYFQNLDTTDPVYISMGLLFCAIIAGSSYLVRSNLLGLTLAEFGGWFIFQIGIEEVGTDYIVSLVSLVIIGLIFFLTISREFWMPLWGFGIFVLPIWLVVQNQTGFIFLPEVLSLILAAINVYLSLVNKLKVEKTFGHFGVTVFLILPNLFAINYGIMNAESELLEPFRQFIIITVFSAFFILYWLFLIVEGELNLSIKVPVSYKFSEEQLRMKSVDQRLNWMMLSSLVILWIAAFTLAEADAYRPILYFAVLMAVMGIVALRFDFEKKIGSSVFLIIILGEIFFVMAEFNLDIDTWSMLPYAAFLAIFGFVFLSILKVNEVFKFTFIRLPAEVLAIIVGLINLYNFTSASLSDFMLQVEIYTTIVWITISYLVTRLKKKHFKGLYVYQLPVLIPLLTLLIVGILHLNTRFDIETNQEHLQINAPMILLLLYSFFLVMGKRLEIPLEEGVERVERKYLKSNRLYFPQIILLIIPMIILIYGKPYFYIPVENQNMLIAYIIVYFVSLPLLIIGSFIRNNENFTVNSGLASFYSLLLSFVFLGGAKQVYDRLTNPKRTFNPDLLIIPIEIATYLFVLIFIASAYWIMLLSRNKIEREIRSFNLIPEVPSQ